MIPNGGKVQPSGTPWPDVGHLASEGGGWRNPFGEAFARAGYRWTAELCAEDSDGDGQSNGSELGDPDCHWHEGDIPDRTSEISHPGFKDSTTSALSAVEHVTSNESLLGSGEMRPSSSSLRRTLH